MKINVSPSRGSGGFRTLSSHRHIPSPNDMVIRSQRRGTAPFKHLLASFPLCFLPMRLCLRLISKDLPHVSYGHCIPSSHSESQKTSINHSRKKSQPAITLFFEIQNHLLHLSFQATLSTFIINPVFIHTLAKVKLYPSPRFSSFIPSFQSFRYPRASP